MMYMEVVEEIRIPVEIEKKIKEISEETGDTKEKIIIEALREYIAEYDDYEEALNRYRDKGDRLITSKELRDSLGI